MAVHGNGSPCEKTQAARKGNMMFQCAKQQTPIHVPTSLAYLFICRKTRRGKNPSPRAVVMALLSRFSGTQSPRSHGQLL